MPDSSKSPSCPVSRMLSHSAPMGHASRGNGCIMWERSLRCYRTRRAEAGQGGNRTLRNSTRPSLNHSHHLAQVLARELFAIDRNKAFTHRKGRGTPANGPRHAVVTIPLPMHQKFGDRFPLLVKKGSPPALRSYVPMLRATQQLWSSCSVDNLCAPDHIFGHSSV